MTTVQELNDAIAMIDGLIAARASASKRSLKRLEHRDPPEMMTELAKVENQIDDLRSLRRVRFILADFRARRVRSKQPSSLTGGKHAESLSK